MFYFGTNSILIAYISQNTTYESSRNPNLIADSDSPWNSRVQATFRGQSDSFFDKKCYAYVDLYPQNSQTYGVGGLTNEIMPSNKLHILRKVKVLYRIEFQGESESAITFWFQ